ncbi:MAG: PIN domain-containing protein [bacterium]
MINIFVDTSAFIALYLIDDNFHTKAIKWLKSMEGRATFWTTNFVLDEVYTFVRSIKNKKTSIDFAEYLSSNSDIVKVKRVSLEEEKEAFNLFKKLDFARLSFTDCTSFAVMKRLKLKQAFSFDKHFKQAGFEMVP